MQKTILITGSTDGIGKLAALKLAKAGHHILVHGRNPEKLALVVLEIKKLSGNEKVDGFVSDFSDLEAVGIMAEQVLERCPSLDVLINNAGIYKSDTVLTKSGLDIRIAVNYLAPYLLTNSILPLLKKSTAPRIINVGSAAQAPVSEAVLSGEEQQPASAAYAQSKLALTMWSFDLADREKGVVVIPVNPGSLLNTKMANEAFGQYWAPAEKGSDLLFDLAVSDDFKNASGKYFDNDKGEFRGKFSDAHTDAYDREEIERLKQVTGEILSKFQNP